MAMGTAGSMRCVKDWVAGASAVGAAHLLVAACMFAQPALVRSSVMSAGAEAARWHGWDWIAGVEAGVAPERMSDTILRNLAERKALGLGGYFVSDKHIGTPNEFEFLSLFRGVE